MYKLRKFLWAAGFLKEDGRGEGVEQHINSQGGELIIRVINRGLQVNRL